MNLYYNITAQCRVDEDNCRLSARPLLHLGAKPVWELHFYSGDPAGPPEAVDLSDIVSWRAAVDSDWNSSTEPMCRTLAADIDSSRKAEGIISVPIDANTQRYLSAVNGKQSVAGWFELRGFDDQGNVSLVVLLNITCNNSIDPAGGAEPEPVDNDTATMTWVRAVIAQQLYFEYSADGSAWHNPPMVPDNDIYFRFRHGQDGTPSAAQLIPYGPQGTPGTDGADGTDGITPHIGANGNWYLGNTDTGVKAEGTDGTDGTDGITPHIGANGDWYLGNTDTGVKAEGTDGADGTDGITPHIGNNGNWYIGDTDTTVHAQGPAGQDGTDGTNGTDGTDGITPHIGNNGNWYLGNTDTGVQAAINGSYIEFSAVDSSGNYTLAGTTTIPYAVLTNAGNFYPVEKGSVTVNTTANTVTVNVAPYLAYDGAASFSGTWRLYFAAGEADPGDEIVTLTGTAITPQHGAVFKKTLAASDAFTVSTASLTAAKQVTFELHLTQPSTAVSFTLPNTLLWPEMDHFASGNTPPDMSEADTVYCIVIRWDGSDLIANLAYTKEVSA